jgi:hypothetical protein
MYQNLVWWDVAPCNLIVPTFHGNLVPYLQVFLECDSSDVLVPICQSVMPQKSALLIFPAVRTSYLKFLFDGKQSLGNI